MKKLFTAYPLLSRYTFAIILFGGALMLNGIIDSPFLKQYFPYLSTFFLLIATSILFKIDKKSLGAIGLNVSLRNTAFLPLGLCIGAVAFFGAKYARALYTGESFVITESINYSTMLYALYTISPTVAVEELLFRGYLYKKTIEVSNTIQANIIFSILFMLIHVLDVNILKNKGMVVLLIITIPVGHMLFATALLKSKTLLFPIGLHLGNNWATRYLIAATDTGNSFFYVTNTKTFDSWVPFISSILIFNGIFLLLTLLIWRWNDFQLTAVRIMKRDFYNNK